MVSIRRINQHNVWSILKLEVDEAQKQFVATNTESIIEAYTTIIAGGIALPFEIYDDDTPVGFLMIGYGEIPEDENPKVAKENYCIWRFMIDKNYQGRGYAKEALRLALDFIKTFPCGKAKLCYLSFEPENAVAARLYHSFGFVENGEYDGDEIVACLPL